MPNHTEAEQAKSEAIRLEIGKLPAELPKGQNQRESGIPQLYYKSD